MAGSRQKWLDALRSFRRGRPLPPDLSTLVDDPAPVVRLCAAGVRWAEGGEVPLARWAAAEAIRSGERDAVIYGCHLLMELGPAAGDIAPLVWEHLRHPDATVRGNAAYAVFKCCRDRRVLAEAAELVAGTTGDRLGDALVGYAAHKLRQAADAEPGAAADRGRTFAFRDS
jgi:hypothetical protein